MSNNQDQVQAKSKNEASSSNSRQFGGFLGGTGDGRLTKNLHLASASVQAATTSKENTSDLMDRLKSFLPQMAKANEKWSVEGSASAEGVEILPVGESSDEDEESSEDEVESSDESSTHSTKVEINISLFPIEDADEDNDVSIGGNIVKNQSLGLDVKRAKKSKVEEVD